MVYSKKWVTDQQNIVNCVNLYRDTKCHSLYDIADILQTNYSNVRQVCSTNIPRDEYDKLRRLRWGRAKLGKRTQCIISTVNSIITIKVNATMGMVI